MARLAVPVLLLLAGMALVVAALNGGERPGGASAGSIASAEMDLLVPGDDGWMPLRIQMLVLVEPGMEPAEAVAVAKAGMLERFPLATEVTPGDVSAQFVLAGWTWPEKTADWAYNPAGAPAGLGDPLAVFQAVAQKWNAAGADFQFTGGAQTQSTPGLCNGHEDDRNVVGWVSSLPGTTLAITCTRFPKGIAEESDVQFDRTRSWTTSTTNVDIDLPSVALHEFGHILGLKHSDVRTAVMYGTYFAGDLVRELTTDDLAGLFQLYGEAETTPTPEPTAASPTPTLTPTPTVASPTPTVVASPPAPSPTPNPSGAQSGGPVFVPGLRAN